MFKNFIVAYDHNANKKVIERVKETLSQHGIESVLIEDDNKDNDYPILAVKAHETYTNQKADGLLLLCGTGVGMNIVANKFKGIRSVLATSEEYAYYSRRHENANTLVLAAGYKDENYEVKFCGRKMVRIISAFVETEFQGEERHIRRISEIDKIDRTGKV